MAMIPPPPPGLTYIAVITPSLNLLIIGTVWAAALVPLLVLLFFLSNRGIRRQPIFLMNVFTVTMGIIIGIVNMKIYVTDILSPHQEFLTRTLLAYLGMILFLPVFMDCILAFRLYVVYPPRATSKILLAVIFIPIVIFKIVRAANLIVFMVKFGDALLVPDSKNAVIKFQILWDTAPWTKIEWILQVFDNCYASAWFLWKIWIGHRRVKDSGAVNSRVGTWHPGTSNTTGSGKLKRLFYFGLSSFVFPCILSIIQVILVFNNHNFFLGAYIFVTNLYVEIIGVLLATIWTAQNRLEDNDSQGNTVSTHLAFKVGKIESTVVSVRTETTNNATARHSESWELGSRTEMELDEFRTKGRNQDKFNHPSAI
ncbi:hypothetical protein BDZ94DRAFT_1241932 [Collybia nuda]|uniref:Uncharacterized protein n=1 Tax=Collybia nuda TaxID=64659 RepID=A0A9P5XUS9_9AGAR|nr:hypothetical protein BDZ94DRAFT_1241932 [Collybia nuda]